MKIERLSSKELVPAPFDGTNLINDWYELFGELAGGNNISENEQQRIVAFTTIYGGIVTFRYSGHHLAFAMPHATMHQQDIDHLRDLIDGIAYDGSNIVIDRVENDTDNVYFIDVFTYFELED